MYVLTAINQITMGQLSEGNVEFERASIVKGTSPQWVLMCPILAASMRWVAVACERKHVLHRMEAGLLGRSSG